MFSAEQLIAIIQELQEKKAQFLPDLNSDIALMQEETDFTFSFFTRLAESVIAGNNQSPEDEIIRFLNCRWEFIQKTSIAYLRHPLLPVNQLCLKVAEMIAGPNQPVYQLLMNTVTDMVRETYSLKSETEEEGHFALEKFILNQAQTRLIPIEEVLLAAAKNTNVVFPEFQQDSKELKYHLNGRDLLNLELCMGENSAALLRALRTHHTRKYDNNSLGFAIKKLSSAIKKGSVRDSGTESYADDAVVAEAIKDFYELWKRISQEIKKEINQLRLNAYGDPNLSIECYFFALFVRHRECLLSEEEFECLKSADIYNCADQISNILDEFLTQHPKIYEFMINQEQTKASLPELDPLLERVISGLKERAQILDDKDEDPWNTFPLLMLQWETPENVANRLAPLVNSYRNLIAIPPDTLLFHIVLSLIQPKLGQLNNVGRIHKLLPNLSDEDQCIILENRFELIFREINVSFTVRYLINLLRPNARSLFENAYLSKLAVKVTTHQELQETLNAVERIQMGNQFLIILAPRLGNLLTCEHEWMGLLNKVNEETQVILADAIINKANNENVLVTLLDRFKNYKIVQKRIIERLQITDASHLLALISHLNEEFRYSLLQHHQSLISNTDLLKQSLNLIPKTHHKDIINDTIENLNITNLDNLQLICLMTDSLGIVKACFAKFDHEKLNCTEEDFNNLFKQICIKITIEKIKDTTLLLNRPFMNPFQLQPIDNHESLDIIYLLSVSPLSDEEKQKKLQYILQNTRNKKLADIINEFLICYFPQHSRYSISSIIRQFQELGNYYRKEVFSIFALSSNRHIRMRMDLISETIKRLESCPNTNEAVENILRLPMEILEKNYISNCRLAKLIENILSSADQAIPFEKSDDFFPNRNEVPMISPR